MPYVRCPLNLNKENLTANKNQQQQQYYTENMIMKGSVDDQANLNQIVPDCIEPMSPEYPLPIHLVCS